MTIAFPHRPRHRRRRHRRRRNLKNGRGSITTTTTTTRTRTRTRTRGKMKIQSQRDCALQPRVARNELPWECRWKIYNPNGVATFATGVASNILDSPTTIQNHAESRKVLDRAIASWSAAVLCRFFLHYHPTPNRHISSINLDPSHRPRPRRRNRSSNPSHLNAPP